MCFSYQPPSTMVLGTQHVSDPEFTAVCLCFTLQAQLRLPASWSRKQKADKVEQVMDLLELQRIKDINIGDEETRGVSGGQRKRVNIGMELVADPTVLFLDEPTSGLDSTSSLTVLRALKRVAAEGGLTIVAVLHQPRYEIFEMFDDVLFLAVGGRTVYLGPTIHVQRYFKDLNYTKPNPNMNPADFYMDTIFDASSEGQEPRDLPDEWNKRRLAFFANQDGAEDRSSASSVNPYEDSDDQPASRASATTTRGASVQELRELQGVAAKPNGVYGALVHRYFAV